MKKHAYTIIITLLLAIACLATCSYAEGWSEQANTYEPVIALYKAALSGDEKSQENEDFNASALMCAVTAGVDPMAAVGCNYVDLDLDGTPELIIGETEALEAEGFLFDIWALKGGKPVLAARGWERNLLYLTVDQATGAFGLYQEGSDSASESTYSQGIFRNGQAEWQHKLLYNDESTAVWTLDGEAVTEDRANELLKGWQSGTVHMYLFPMDAPM